MSGDARIEERNTQMGIPEEEAVSKLPPGRVFQLPTELDHLWDGLDDIGLGLRWLSEVKKADMQIELGGPKWDYKMFSIFYIEEDPSKVKDGEVKLIGPDVNEVKPGTSLPGLFTIRIYGKTLTQEHQGYVSRQIGTALQGLEGFMLFGSPDALWIRISKDVANRLTYDKTVASEEVGDFAELMELLIQKGHPIVKMVWKSGEINQLRSCLGASPA